MTPSASASSDRPVVGIDLGGTNMQVGVVDGSNTIISREKRKTRAIEGAEAVIDRIAEAVRDVCREADLAVDDLAAVGIAAAGAIDMPNGVILNAPNLGWDDFPLRDALAEKLEARIYLENDVNAAVWGEYVLGAMHGEGDVLGVWIGTGVGGGLIINGRIYHGDRFTAGEIGHTVIDLSDPPGRRKLEEVASRSGMSREIIARMHAYPDSIMHELLEDQRAITGSKMLKQAYESEDVLAVSIVHHAAEALGVAIANVVTLLSLDTVIIGGGVTEALGEPWLSRIRESFADAVFPSELRDCRIIPTQLEDDAGLLGAALLAREDAGAVA